MFRMLFAYPVASARWIVTQLLSLFENPTFHPLNFLSYFTIQSNLIGGAVLLDRRNPRRDIHTPTFDLVRGGAVSLPPVTTGIVFSVLLSGTDVDTAIPWVNSILHEVLPIVDRHRLAPGSSRPPADVPARRPVARVSGGLGRPTP